MRLSDNFTLEEFVVSRAAARRGLDNTPPQEAIERLRDLCIFVLEPLCRHLGRPVVILSGYRCPDVNRAVEGAPESQHMQGEAADIIMPGRSLAEVFNWIYSNAAYDQLIREFPPGGWVHVSYRPAGRQLALQATRGAAGLATYSPVTRPLET